MSENNSTPLFELIKSLSGSEKRYFKLFATRHVIGESNVYASLFDLIDKQDIYDEKKILAADKKIKANQFHNIKKYLYDIILKSLNSYYINDTNDTKVRQMIHQVKILYEKTLYSHAEKIIRKAKKIIIAHEFYTAHIDLLYFERAISNNSLGIKELEKNLKAISKEEKTVIEKMRLFNEIKALQDVIFSISISGKGRVQKERMKKQWPLLKEILQKGEDGELTFDMWRFLCNACALYYRAMGNAERNYFYNKKIMTLYDDNEERYIQNIERYIQTLHNFLIACEEYRKDEIPEILNKLKKISDTHSQVKSSFILQAKIFQMCSMIQMDLLTAKGEFKQGVILINKEINDQLGKYEKVMPVVYKWHLYYSIAMVNFGAGRYADTHSWLNKLLNDKGSDLKHDVATAARILNLMTHIELENSDYLEYIFKATSRFLTTKIKLSKVETLVLAQFEKMIKKTLTADPQLSFISLKKQLLPLQNNINEKSIFAFIDIISWLESKIEKRSFAEIVKEKAK